MIVKLQQCFQHHQTFCSSHQNIFTIGSSIDSGQINIGTTSSKLAINITPPNPADIIAPAGQSLNQQPNPAGASVGAAPPQAGNPAAAAITGGGPPINKVGTTPAEVAQKNAMPFLPNRAATGVS